jgi:MFS family permease
MRVIYRDPLLRYLVLFAWMPVFYIVPEAIAPAYARSLGGGATTTGLLMAAMPAGTAIGAWAFGGRGSDAARARAVPYLAAASSVMLICCWAAPVLAVSLLLWLLCGVFSAYQISVTTRFVRRTPDHLRGQAVGLGSAGLIAVQGVGAVAAGVLASVWSPGAAVATAGAAGLLSVAALAAPLRRAERHAAQEQPAAAVPAHQAALP